MSLLVGICGGTGSGKTTLADRLVERLRGAVGFEAATTLSFDAYYHDQGHLPRDERARVNYDHPDSLDADLLIGHLVQLQQRQEAAVPIYDFATHTRTDEVRIVGPADVVVVEGILLFAFERVCELLDFRVFRDCPEDIRFARRIQRDRVERGRSLASIQAQLEATVKPMHDRFVQPHSDKAHFITHHGDDLDDVTEQLLVRLMSLAPASP